MEAIRNARSPIFLRKFAKPMLPPIPLALSEGVAGEQQRMGFAPMIPKTTPPHIRRHGGRPSGEGGLAQAAMRAISRSPLLVSLATGPWRDNDVPE